MKKEINVKELILRYLSLLVIGIFHSNIFYFIFTPLTIYPVYFLLMLFFNVSLASNVIMVNSFPIEIIDSCIAGSAYYLLLILNLATPEIKLKKRVKLLLFSFLSLLAVNIIRIFSLSILFIYGRSSFNFTHKLFWYAGSTIFVAGIWFLSVALFKLKEVPFYSDIKQIIQSSKGKKKARKLRKKPKKTKANKKH